MILTVEAISAIRPIFLYAQQMGIFSRALLDLTWYLGLAAQQCPQRAFQFLWFRCAFIIFSGIHYRNTQVNRRWQVRINMISRISASSLACALTVRIVEIGFIIGNRLSTTHLTVFSRNKTYRLKMCLPAQMTSRPGLFWFSWKMYSNKILKWCYAKKKTFVLNHNKPWNIHHGILTLAWW